MAAETKREHVGSVIRMLREGDTAAVTEILRRAPEAVFWSESSVREVLRWEGTLALVSETEGATIGFLIGKQTAGEAEILNLAVAQGSRRRGEGSALVRAAVEEFRMRGVSRVFLEVRESNDVAITFYLKRGFTKAGRREGYYREPEEAALVMERILTA